MRAAWWSSGEAEDWPAPLLLFPDREEGQVTLQWMRPCLDGPTPLQ